MDKLTSILNQNYRNKSITPVIIEATPQGFIDVRDTLRQIVPINQLETQFHTFLPRVLGVVEVPITKFKEISTFNMVATALTSPIIEDVAQMRSVKRIYPDSMIYANSTIPPGGIYTNNKNKDFTSNAWTKQLLGLDVAKSKGYSGNGITAAVLDTGARKSVRSCSGARCRRKAAS